MGILIAESSTHTEEIYVENGVKDSKKKKRRSRRSKQNCSVSGNLCIGHVFFFASRFLLHMYFVFGWILKLR